MDIRPAAGYCIVTKIKVKEQTGGLFIPTDVPGKGSGNLSQYEILRYNENGGGPLDKYAYAKPEDLLKIPTQDGSELYAVKLEDVVAYS